MKKHKKLIFAFFIKSVCNVFFFLFSPHPIGRRSTSVVTAPSIPYP